MCVHAAMTVGKQYLEDVGIYLNIICNYKHHHHALK